MDIKNKQGEVIGVVNDEKYKTRGLAYAARQANLRDLSDADFRGLNILDHIGGDTRFANMILEGADFTGCDLTDTTFHDCQIDGAIFTDAKLSKAGFLQTDTTGAVFDEAPCLKGVQQDYYSILEKTPNELAGLRDALVEGRVDGSVYAGECACLVGTVAQSANGKVMYSSDVARWLRAERGIITDGSRPAERMFMGIKPGDTPENNVFSATAVRWLDEFMEARG